MTNSKTLSIIDKSSSLEADTTHLTETELLTILLNATKQGIINIDDVLHKEEEMTKHQILSEHKYAIKYNVNDNRWHTYVPDETKPHQRRPIAKRKKDDLENYLVQFYKEQQEKSVPKTFKLAFENALDEKLKFATDDENIISKKNTILKYRSEYTRFISDTDIENKCVNLITKKDIEKLCLLNLKRYKLKKKAFNSLRGILKLTFDYAYNEYWIVDNIYNRMDFKPFAKLIVPDTPIKQRAHTQEEIKAIIKELHERETTSPKRSAPWALEMQLIIGSRRGEIPPLEITDIHEDYVTIDKEQLYNEGNYTIVNHTKTHQDRDFPISDDLKDLLERLMARNRKLYSNSKYLFPHTTSDKPITGNAMYKEYASICKALGIEKDENIIKGPHSFRRNAITDVVNSTNGNTVLASSIFGNSPEVIRKNYYTGTDLEIARASLNKRKLVS